MIDPKQYWILHSINSLDCYQSVAMSEARDFFVENFQRRIQEEMIKELEIQKKLFSWYRYGTVKEQAKAKLCLRCFVSHCIYHICLHTEQKYRENYGLTRNDLFPVVLEPLRQFDSYISEKQDSLIAEIIDTFDLEKKSNLSTWANIKVKGNRDYKRILKFYNIVEITNWLLLVKTTPGKLERKLKERLFSREQKKEYGLFLEAFHQVYTPDLILMRQKINQERLTEGRKKSNKPYPQPTEQQLMKIARIVNQTKFLEPHEVLSKLKEIALLLRTDRDNNNSHLIAADVTERSPDREWTIMLQEQIENNLVTITTRIIKRKTAIFLNRNKPQKLKAQNFILSLKLFHCDNYSMGKIASKINFATQSKVSRLLNLKELREDISREAIAYFKENFTEQLNAILGNNNKLIDLDDTIQEFIENEITEIMKEAHKENFNSQNRNRNSLLSRIVCQCAQKIRIE